MQNKTGKTAEILELLLRASKDEESNNYFIDVINMCARILARRKASDFAVERLLDICSTTLNNKRIVVYCGNCDDSYFSMRYNGHTFCTNCGCELVV